MGDELRFREGALGLAKRIYRRANKGYRTVRNALLFARFRLLNQFSRRPVTGAGDAVVSLTSYGKRALVCAYGIESIARGAVRPRRLILWLDDEALLATPPKPLQRLVARGLEIRACPLGSLPPELIDEFLQWRAQQLQARPRPGARA